MTDEPEARFRIQRLLIDLGVRVGLNFGSGRKGEREVRKLLGGIIATGDEPLPVPMFGKDNLEDPKRPKGVPETNFGSDEHPLIGDKGKPKPAKVSRNQRERISLTKVSRGDWRCTFPNELAGRQLIWAALAQSFEFSAETFHRMAAE